ncbi:methyltransferase domain-containing protein [bacterium]|nr:methyltransferase domain-containing protein [bacterium]
MREATTHTKTCQRLLGLASERVKNNDLEAAKEILEAAISLSPENSLAHYHLGSVLKRLGHSERGLEQFKKAEEIAKSWLVLDVDTFLGGIYFHQGECLLKLGKKELAASSFKKCNSLIPNHAKSAEHLRSLSPKPSPKPAAPNAQPSQDVGYQRFVIDGKEILKGQLDTLKKFEQMTQGIDLKGKRVLDIGFRAGAMCYYAWKAGAASVLGMDIERDLRIEAEKRKEQYFPEAPISFGICKASRIPGQYDVIFASALFHWLEDTDITLRQMARVLHPDGVFLLDVWVTDSDMRNPPIYSPRPGHAGRVHWIPNQRAIRLHLSQFFEKVEFGELVETPNNTDRRLIQCREPKPHPTQAIVIYGDPNAGKTTMAYALEYGRGFDRLSLDDVFCTWYFHAPSDIRDVGKLKDAAYKPYELEFINQWAASRTNTDIVIEGGRLRDSYNQRDKVTEILRNQGWENILEVGL